MSPLAGWRAAIPAVVQVGVRNSKLVGKIRALVERQAYMFSISPSMIFGRLGPPPSIM
jgi:hypothetical protein